jgi:hypothetical protein
MPKFRCRPVRDLSGQKSDVELGETHFFGSRAGEGKHRDVIKGAVCGEIAGDCEEGIHRSSHGFGNGRRTVVDGRARPEKWRRTGNRTIDVLGPGGRIGHSQYPSVC